jgi:hypothetical protein
MFVELPNAPGVEGNPGSERCREASIFHAEGGAKRSPSVARIPFERPVGRRCAPDTGRATTPGVVGVARSAAPTVRVQRTKQPRCLGPLERGVRSESHLTVHHPCNISAIAIAPRKKKKAAPPRQAKRMYQFPEPGIIASQIRPSISSGKIGKDCCLIGRRLRRPAARNSAPMAKQTAATRIRGSARPITTTRALRPTQMTQLPDPFVSAIIFCPRRFYSHFRRIFRTYPESYLT